MADAQDNNQAQPAQQPQGQQPAPPAGGAPPPAGGTQPTPPPAGAMPPPGGAPPPPAAQPEDTTPANFDIAKHLPETIALKLPAHSLQFDEQKFLHLLAGSISLSKDEKKRIIESLPKLKQEQVGELIRIFDEERKKFAELPKKHTPQLEKLVKQHWADWQDIELAQKAGEKQGEDQQQADEIRKKLGL